MCPGGSFRLLRLGPVEFKVGGPPCARGLMGYRNEFGSMVEPLNFGEGQLCSAQLTWTGEVIQVTGSMEAM